MDHKLPKIHPWGDPSLTDISAESYLLLTKCFNLPFKGNNCFQGGRRFQDIGAMGVGVRDGCGGPNIYS